MTRLVVHAVSLLLFLVGCDTELDGTKLSDTGISDLDGGASVSRDVIDDDCPSVVFRFNFDGNV